MVTTNFAGYYSVRAYKQDYGMGPYSTTDFGFSKGLQPPTDVQCVQQHGSDWKFDVSISYPNEGPRPTYFQYQYWSNSGGYKAGSGTRYGTSWTISDNSLDPPDYGERDVTFRIKSVRGSSVSDWQSITFKLRDINN